MKNLLSHPFALFLSGRARRSHLVLVCSLLFVGGLLLLWMARASHSGATAHVVRDAAKLSAGVQRQIKALLSEKAARTPAQQKLLTGSLDGGQAGLLYVLRDSLVGNQIFSYSVNETTGALTPLAGFPISTGSNGAEAGNSEMLAIDRANLRLYALNRGFGTINAYSINTTTGALAPLPFSPITLGTGQWSTVAVHPSGSPLVAARGNGTQLVSYQITATTATAAAGSPYSTGSASGFSSVFSQDGNYVYTGGLSSTLAGFSVNATTGVLTALPGSPFSSIGINRAALATDTMGRLFGASFVIGGQLSVVTTSSGIPTGVAGNPFSSGLLNSVHGLLHPGGFYLVADDVGNRVGVYRINGSGSATTLAPVPGSPFATGGSGTMVLTTNQTGAFLFVGHRLSRNLTTFSINSTTGALTLLSTQPANSLGASGQVSGIAYLPLSVSCAILSPDSLPNGTIGTAYNQTITASPSGSYTFAVAAGSLPAGLSLNSMTGTITGTPTRGGTSNFTITATGSANCSGSQAYSISIPGICPTISDLKPTIGTAGTMVTITGAIFTGVTGVKFAGNATASFTVNSDTQITASVPAGATTGPITLIKLGCEDVQTPAFTINTPRTVRAGNVSGAPDLPVSVPIDLVSQGDENAISFSLTFDPAILSNPQVVLGSAAAAGQLTVNTLQAAQGQLGIVISLGNGQRFSAGTRQVAVVTFTVAANAATGVTPIGFGDQPVAREVTSDPANLLPANYTVGTVTIQQPNPVPTITLIVPTTVGAGGNAFMLTVTGTNFVNGSKVQWNGSVRTTVYLSSTTIVGQIPAVDIAAPGTVSVTVANPAPGGGTSNAMNFIIGQMPTTQITLDPASPNSNDAITVRLSGMWSDSCVPQNAQFTATGNELRINTSNTGAVCLAVLTPWSLNVPIGRLAVGAYNLRVVHTAQSGPLELGRLSFTVNTSVASVSAASFLGAELAAESIVAAFGVNLATSVEIANTTPLPTTLAGTKVTVRDSAGIDRLSPLFFVAPSQVNYQMPPGTANGVATVTITSGDGKTSVGTQQITSVAPGLFTANANGLGVPAATVFRLRSNGTTADEPLAQYDSTLMRFVPLPIDLGPEADQVFAVLFGTGFRNNTGLPSVSVKIGGTDVEVLYAGVAPGFVGLDQCNARIPRSLAGRGEVDLVMTVNGKVANTVRISIK